VTILTDRGVSILSDNPLTFERGIVQWNATVRSNYRHGAVSMNSVAYVRNKLQNCDMNRTRPFVVITRILFLPPHTVKRENPLNFL
jgi:hypothetical protein